MTKADIKRLGLILAIQAEIEGMKAYNTAAKRITHYVPFDLDQFEEKAEESQEIVYKHDDQL